MTTTETLHITKDVLLQRLRDGLERAGAEDAKALSQHKSKQGRWCADARKVLRGMLDLDDEHLVEACARMLGQRWSDEDAKVTPVLWRKDVPACPIAQVATYEEAIERIELDRRVNFALDPREHMMRLIVTKKERKVC